MISLRARTAFERGQEWQERGDPTKAIKAFREAVADGWGVRGRVASIFAYGTACVTTLADGGRGSARSARRQSA